MNRFFRYILLATFFGALMVIVFLQFNSNRSINQLINGNEDLLEELSLKSSLQQLQTNIVDLESKVRGTVIEGLPIDSTHLQMEINNIRISLKKLDSLHSFKMIEPLLTDLKELVQEKINFNRNVLNTFTDKGKIVAERFVTNSYGISLTNSINLKAAQIDEVHQITVTALIREADNNGRKAKTSGTIIALLAALASIFTFGNVALKVRQQQLLIEKLNASEKKAREAVQVKENFLANMSHEIRTPMNAILGFTNLLQRKNLDNESNVYVQTIQKSGEKLLTIINDILDLSKIEAGMMRIESAPFSIRSLIHSIETMFSSKAVDKNLQLTSIVEESVPDNLDGDPTRLTQILVNLIGNALKFTGTGTIAVKISNEGISNNIIRTGITISDTGIGIEKEKLATIFERFQQAEDSVTRKYGGTGLGLSIVKDLVLLQNGNIKVESEPGKGTTFRLMIPYKISSEKFTPTDTFKPESDFKDKSILVAEDNEINQSLIKHLFNIWQLDFDMVNNGREAIDKLMIKKYDLILMDIQMPVMDGYSAALEIRDRLKLTTPIIAMTAHAFAGEREKCLSYGMNEYISKPIKEEQLHKLITIFTKLNTPVTSNNEIKTNLPSGEYKYINLKYMREVSGGTPEYEKTVTEQFIEAIPGDLLMLQKAWEENNIPQVRQIAHNLKTTISVMGLNDKLDSRLDVLEYKNTSEYNFKEQFKNISEICNFALEEARMFLKSNLAGSFIASPEE